jgi:hypothetical protein
VKKKSDLRKATNLALGGAMALQGVKVMKDVKSGASLVPSATGMIGIGIAGITTNMALDLIEQSAYPVKKRVKRKRG